MAWSTGINLKGLPGQNGAQVYFTSTTPTDSTASANNGDIAFAQDTFQFYQRINGTWTQTSNTLKGAQGDRGEMGVTGQAGSNFIAGMSAPTASQGKPGDVYLYLATGEVFGPKGSDGSWPDTGYTMRGAPGLRGSQIFTGTGAPPSDASTLSNGNTTGAQSGDLYIDTNGPTLYVLS